MSRPRIVAVDDDRRILRLIKRASEALGYEVHSVLDAEFFASSFRAFDPSLIFLDLHTGTIDGIELLRFIASEKSQTSVIVVSGVDQRLLDAAHSLGVSLGLDMLPPMRKPLAFNDLRQRLHLFATQPRPRVSASIGKAALSAAIENRRIELCYQPLIDLASRRVVCVEALARLRCPGGEIVMPGQFIPLAEDCGLIHDVTFCVLDQAIMDLALWSRTAPWLQLSVNVSPLSLCDTALEVRIDALLCEYDMAPQRLVLEVTETSAPDDRGLMADTLGRLRRRGLRLALDDFGTGLCSVGQLYEFPFETVKLDRKFAMNARSDGDAAAMIRSTLELARRIGLTVVVEGIEDEETLHWLTQLGCHVGQGFHLGPPLGARTLTDCFSHPDAGAVLCGAPLSIEMLGAA